MALIIIDRGCEQAGMFAHSTCCHSIGSAPLDASGEEATLLSIATDRAETKLVSVRCDPAAASVQTRLCNWS